MHRITTRAAIMLLLATFAAGCDASRGDLAQTFSRARTNSDATAVAGAEGAPGEAGAPGASASVTQESGSGELPEAWPDDLALPARSSVGATTSIVTDDTSTVSVSGSVVLPQEVVREHFDQQFDDWEPSDGSWEDGVATWAKGLERARVVVGSQGAGVTGFTVRLD